MIQGHRNVNYAGTQSLDLKTWVLYFDLIGCFIGQLIVQGKID